MLQSYLSFDKSQPVFEPIKTRFTNQVSYYKSFGCANLGKITSNKGLDTKYIFVSNQAIICVKSNFTLHSYPFW